MALQELICVLGRSAGVFSWGGLLGSEVEREQILDVGVWTALWQLRQDMGEPGMGIDAACPACENQAVDDGAGLGAGNGIAEQPIFSASYKNSDVALKQVVINRRATVVGIAVEVDT
jgi:hypothetical protein